MKVLIAGVVAFVLAMAATPIIGRGTTAVAPPPPAAKEDPVVATVKAGPSVDLQSCVPAEGLTLVQFTTASCDVCQTVASHLEGLATGYPHIKLRFVEVGGQGSTQARRYSLRNLPEIWLFEDGEFYSKDREEIADRLTAGL